MAEKTRVLVVDDEEVVHASIKRILARLSIEVESAMTAREGMALLEKGGFDAVITDLMMPEMNGIDLLTRMEEAGIHIPAIMVTGYPTIKTAIKALGLGAVDYIPKPFTRHELLGPLNRALKRCPEDPGGPPRQTRETSEEPPLEPEGNAPRPREVYYLPEHAWAAYLDNGLVEIGIEASFLDSIAQVDYLELPPENDLIEQGFAGLKLKACGEAHNVFMPLSGRVVEVNQVAADHPERISARTWLIRTLPSHLNQEVELLKKRSG